uniref:Saccharopine dehydrogenase NADP binding domain-containing protein n=1 Tax=Arion vulgaris TaxID=1028688 RepID=A0A0B6Y7D7_9EUPU
MEGRKFDIILFGASGFTGQYTVDEVARVAEEEHLTWAVAGRSMHKLQKVLSEASSRTGKNLDETAIIIADTSSPASLHEMASQGKVVLNCVGPYRFYGEAVVKACIEAGTHHLDISGEAQFLENTQLLYNAIAKENNVFIIGSVGFDSIPAEMGLKYTWQQFQDGELTNVESYMSGHSGPESFTVNTGTFESAVYGFSHMKELKPLRKSLYPEPMPRFEYRLPKRRVLFYSKEVNKWCLPFPGSDKSVVYRTVRDHLANGRLVKPIEFNPYFCVDSLAQALGLVAFVFVFGLFASFSFGQTLLLKYPHIFSFGFFKKGGPTKKQIDACSFSMTFIGHGYNKVDKDRADKTPDKILTSKILGPEPGYVATPIFMTQAAVTLLKEKDKITQRGGVLTPGAAFWNTSLIDRLQAHNIKFITVSDSSSTDKKNE